MTKKTPRPHKEASASAHVQGIKPIDGSSLAFHLAGNANPAHPLGCGYCA